MARNMLGLDIDFAGIRAVETVRKGRQTAVTKLAEQPIPAGTVVDGKVVNSQVLGNELQSFLSKQRFQANSVTLGLRSSWVTVKIHRFPAMPKRELDKALEFEIPDLVSFQAPALKDVAYDYFVNSRTDNEVEVVVVSCPRQHLDPYIKLMREAGLSLEAIDVPAFGWQELLADDKRRGFVEVNEEQTTIQISLDGIFRVLRVIPLGMMHFRKSVQEAFEISAEEAQSLIYDRDLDYLLTEGAGSKRSIRSTIQQFSGSILQTLDFIRAQERAANYKSMMDEIVFLGDLAGVAGVAEMLQKEMDLPVLALRQIDTLTLTMDFQRPPHFDAYGSALALGMRGLDL